MKKALKRRISLSLKEIKTKKHQKHHQSLELLRRNKVQGAAGTNLAGENENVPEVRLCSVQYRGCSGSGAVSWFFQRWGCRGLPQADAFPVQPCYLLPTHVDNHLPGTLSMVLSFIPAKTMVPVNSTSTFTSLHLSHLYCHTACKASFSRTRQSRAVSPK